MNQPYNAEDWVFTDLHFAIMSVLPKQGSKLGYHPLCKSVKRVVAEINEPLPAGLPRLTSSEVSSAMRTLRLAGHVVQVRSGGTVVGWQVCRSGQRLLDGWTPPNFDEQELS